MTNPYRIPDDGRNRTINFSGGRSSGYMLRNILDAHDGQIPPNTIVVFCNTGKEMPQTLDFVNQVQLRWDVPIAWLEYMYQDQRPKHHYRIVNHNSAARNGEPFADMLLCKKMLPNVVTRFCTSELKVRTVQRYVRRSLGWTAKHVINVLGIRYDEPRRWQKAILEHCNTEYPMVHDRVTKQRVLDWWSNNDFDLAIDSMYGNCDLCFMKGRVERLAIMRQRPDLAQWWINQEKEITERTGRQSSFIKHPDTYERQLRHSQDDLFLDADLDDGSDNSCFCTD